MAVRYLGPERYGVWATVTTTAVWLNLLDLGIANTLTNHISPARMRLTTELRPPDLSPTPSPLPEA